MAEELKFQIDQLTERLSKVESGSQNKISMIVFNSDLDKLLAAMNIATGAAASGMEVVMFFTFWGISALRDRNKKIKNKTITSKFLGRFLPNGSTNSKLSKLNMLGLGTLMIKRMMKNKNIPSLESMIEMAGHLGVKIFICEMSMGLMGFQRNEMLDYPNLKFCGVATFLAEAKESKIQLFIS